MKTMKRVGAAGTALGLCMACQSGPADPSVQVVKAYYASGQLRQTSAVQHGQFHGPVVWYYRNGARKTTAHFVQGVSVGNTVLFDSTGKPVERHVYDATGRMIYVSFYDPRGRSSDGGLLPVIDAPDTILRGRPFAGSIHFGYALQHPATLLVGTFARDPKRPIQPLMLDTLQRVTQSPDGRFYFSCAAVVPGNHTFAFRFIQPETRFEPTIVGSRTDDSLGVDYLGGNQRYYVK